MITEKHYVLVIKDSCPHCHTAVELLKEIDVSFLYTDMEFATRMMAATCARQAWYTVPMIWEQDIVWEDNEPVVKESVFIGGLSELRERLNDREE